VDNNAGTITPGRTNTASIATAATTTVVGSPGAGVQRNVKYLSVFNTHASVSNLVTIQHTDGTNVQKLWVGTLLAGEFVVMDQNGTWTYYNASGVPYTNNGPGRFLQSTLLTTGTTFTTGTQTTKLRIRAVAGGGGGGGITAAIGGSAGGGGAGSYFEWVVAVQPNTAYTYAIGAAGAANSGAAGGNGGNTTFAVGGTTATANAGQGAAALTGTAAVSVSSGGLGGTVSTNGTLNAVGMPGNAGFTVNTAGLGGGGEGGSSPFGAGGKMATANTAGNAAGGFGAGGGGANTTAATARAGGAGTAGCILVEEYA
jgi:hypothetical protein